MRIAGVRLGAPVARLLADVLEREGFPETAARVAAAIEQRITVEAPLAIADYDAILEALSRDCPPTLLRVRDRLLDEQRRVRRITGA